LRGKRAHGCFIEGKGIPVVLFSRRQNSPGSPFSCWLTFEEGLVTMKGKRASGGVGMGRIRLLGFRDKSREEVPFRRGSKADEEKPFAKTLTGPKTCFRGQVEVQKSGGRGYTEKKVKDGKAQGGRQNTLCFRERGGVSTKGGGREAF